MDLILARYKRLFSDVNGNKRLFQNYHEDLYLTICITAKCYCDPYRGRGGDGII